MISPRSIFLVEDNPDDEKLIMRALRRSQVTSPVQIARDGEEALQVLFSHDHLPSVVLLDLQLPKVDGLEVLERIRAHERTQLLPVVVLAASNEARDIAESYRLGANSYVQKTANDDQFADAVSQLGTYWALINAALPGGL